MKKFIFVKLKIDYKFYFIIIIILYISKEFISNIYKKRYSNRIMLDKEKIEETDLSKAKTNRNLHNKEIISHKNSKFQISTIKKFIVTEKIDFGLTSSFYSNYNLHIENLKNILNKSSNHGLTGLKNIGNSSYMNSIIQCLSHCQDLAYYYISDLYLNDLKIKPKPNSNSKNISQSFSLVLKQLWIEQEKSINPIDLKYSISKYYFRYINSNQNDSNEFLLSLLCTLHEEINQPKVNGIIKFNEEPKLENESEINSSKRFWNLFKKMNNSIIINLFYGQIRNIMKCLSCTFVQTNFEVFSILPLEIPYLKKINILLIPSNNIKTPIQINLFISDTALFIDIGVYIRQYINSGFENFKILLFNYNNSSIKFVKLSENIFNLSKKGMIILYEISDSISNESDIKENENNDNENNITDEYYPFISFFRYKNFADIINNNFITYPRLFFVNSFSKVKTLRIMIFGLLLNFYPLPKFFENDVNDIERIKYNYIERNIEPNDFELFNIYQNIYNKLFKNQDNNDEEINEYLEKFPFKIYLISTKKENEEKLFLSNNYKEFQIEIQDNTSIKKLIELMKQGYKIIINISNKEIIENLNKITIIEEDKSEENEKIPNLNDLLIHFSLHEKMDKENEWYCPNCKKLSNAYKKLDLFYLPKYLILSLKRYNKINLSKFKIQLTKKNDLVNFPIENLDLDNFVFGPKIPKNNYDLFAVSQHSGSNEGGHYFSICKNFNSWYMFDDENFFKCDKDIICTEESYILFYKRKNGKQENIKINN